MTPRAGECRLCSARDVELCRSHVIPEAFFRPMYDSNGRAIAWQPATGRSWPIQVGLRQYMLCAGCEELLNRRFEQPFIEQWRRSLRSFSGVAAGCHVVLEGLDYATLKLFHLSVLFRAQVSDLDAFARLDVGAYLHRIREMILASDPGEATEFPIVATAALDDSGSICRGVMPPVAFRVGDAHVVRSFFGGCEWDYVISTRLPELFDGISLRDDGRLPVSCQRFRDLPLVRDMREILGGSRSSGGDSATT